MLIQYASDLHLEFAMNREFIRRFPLEPKGDILLLAGDVVPFAGMHKHTDFFSYVSDNFETVYWLPGNHEYYYSDAVHRSGTMNEKIKSNVFLVNNTVIQNGNVNLIFSILWSKISPAKELIIKDSMSDFEVIKYKRERITPSVYNALHLECKEFLVKNIKQNNQNKTIVVTHHVPTFMHYPEKYRTSNINEGFATELFDFIEESNADYWIYGHHHCNIPAFTIGKTQLLTNQLGYVESGENQLFDRSAIINI